MEKVGFITPTNESIFMDYYEVEVFCKKICLQEENLESFEKFKRGYTYFSPYFDFVMIHKKYLFINCLFNNNNFLVFNDGAYYFSYLICDNYQDNINFFKEHQYFENYSDLTVVSDNELDIKKQSLEYEDDCMIDPNMIGMMSMTKVGSWYGSHIVTASTVLNQLLIKSKSISLSYYDFSIKDEIYNEENPINYLINCLGFLRIACRDTFSPIVMCNKSIISEECLKFFEEAVDAGYKPYDVNGVMDYDYGNTSGVKEYIKCMK